MTTHFNGAELEAVHFNGVDCEKVYFNGTLVFEKATTTTYEVDLIDWGGGEAGGSVSPAHPVFGDIYWFGFAQGEASSDLFMGMASSNTSHPGSVKVTFGGMTITLHKSFMVADWLATLTRAQWNALPKSGVHPIIIEAIP